MLFLVFLHAFEAYLSFYNRPNATANAQNTKFKLFARLLSSALLILACPTRWTPGLNAEILTELLRWPCYKKQTSAVCI